jgi:hypothetical protein
MVVEYIVTKGMPDEILKLIEEGIFNEPTHIQREAGVLEWAAGWQLPSDLQLGLMKVPQFLQAGGAFWSGLEIAGRIEIMTAIGCPTRYCLKEDTMDILVWMPGVTVWLTGWQKQINSGACWFAPGRFGKMADELLDTGFLLHSTKPVTGFHGQVYPTRETVPAGEPGSKDFVRATKGERYLEWILAVE